MVKTYSVAVLLVAAAALCMAALMNVAEARKEKDTSLYVEGKVYCDTCRVQFVTPISEYIAGATVTLLCRNRMTELVTVKIDAVTDKSGNYTIKVDNDHADSICEVHLTHSPREDCNEVTAELNAARILLTNNVGIVDPVRYANALGFMKKEALKNCGEVLKGMGNLPWV
ncbi:hypothetical protein LWI28_002476 [Acer negundo]|uniref:Uncharacterized protein n=1 Tax=Acer negundo TaxID=4023 RepID=A0AAD5NVJ9_ACENE|nr:hypothetical protein LWI28_002476 [Acer negundo]KAK4851696.1 hypothetical protein QYF36_017610 [Acer negundo]